MFTGTGTALITPFKDDGTVDFEALRWLINYQIESGIDFLVPCGTTGESPTLLRDDHVSVIAFTVEVVEGRLPVLAGTGSNNTFEAVEP